MERIPDGGPEGRGGWGWGKGEKLKEKTVKQRLWRSE